MSLVDRLQGKARIQPIIDFFEEFCSVNNENKKDVLAFEYRRQLHIEGKQKSARTFESFHKQPSQILVKPLSPRKTASRAVMTGMSWNKSRDEYTYLSQKGLHVLAGPCETDLYRWSISPMNVSFTMESLDGQFKADYVAPIKPVKPSNVDWSNRQEKETLKKNYAKKLTLWKNKLRPVTGSLSLGSPTTPESVKPNILSASYPYANVLAHSLYDSRHIIKENILKHGIPAGDVNIHTHASDGCDGFGNWDLISKKTDVELPDHGLSYDYKVMRIESTDHGVILFEDCGASVNACHPVMRAAANENCHFSTHSLTIPIERERSALEKVRIKGETSELKTG